MRPPKRKVKSRKDLRVEIAYEDVNSLKLWMGNPRENEQAAEKLLKSFDAYGFINPVVGWRKNRTIYVGNTRLKAARKQGLEQIPVIWYPFRSEEEAEAFGLMDNRSHENSKWKQDMLAEMFSKLKEVDLLGQTGFSQLEISQVGPKKRTFREAVRQLDKDGHFKDEVDPFVWFEIPSENADDFQTIMARYGKRKKGGKKTTDKLQRELSWKKLRRVLLGG